MTGVLTEEDIWTETCKRRETHGEAMHNRAEVGFMHLLGTVDGGQPPEARTGEEVPLSNSRKNQRCQHLDFRPLAS